MKIKSLISLLQPCLSRLQRSGHSKMPYLENNKNASWNEFFHKVFAPRYTAKCTNRSFTHDIRWGREWFRWGSRWVSWKQVEKLGIVLRFAEIPSWIVKAVWQSFMTSLPYLESCRQLDTDVWKSHVKRTIHCEKQGWKHQADAVWKHVLQSRIIRT